MVSSYCSFLVMNSWHSRHVSVHVIQGMRQSLLFATITDQRERLQTTSDVISFLLAVGVLGALLSPPFSAVADR